MLIVPTPFLYVVANYREQVGKIKFISIMRTLRLIGTTLLMVVLCLNFTACGDDDEDDNRPLVEKLIGHWVLTYEEGFEKDFEHPEYDEAWSHAPKDECEYFGTSPLGKTVLIVNMIWTVQVTRRVLRNGK